MFEKREKVQRKKYTRSTLWSRGEQVVYIELTET